MAYIAIANGSPWFAPLILSPSMNSWVFERYVVTIAGAISGLDVL